MSQDRVKGYRAIIEEIGTRRRFIVMPRSRKTTLFKQIQQAEHALGQRGRKLGAAAENWRGLIYPVDRVDGIWSEPLITMAI